MTELNAAYEQHQKDGKPGVPSWPKKLRVKPVEGKPNVFELTWSFSGPDGRATFEYVQIDGELGIFWRRIGLHGILRDP